jgi:hypothetical protein
VVQASPHGLAAIGRRPPAPRVARQQLHELDLPAAFQAWYTFSTAYGLADPLAYALPALLPRLRSVPATQAGYRERYGSGHAPSTPITDLNWPVYWCGIALLEQQALTDCVSRY